MTETMARGGAQASWGGTAGGAGDRLRRVGHWATAGTSIALVALMAVWAHDTMTREIEGVPVIRAFAGSMRVAPADAGPAVELALSVGRVAEGNGVAPAPTVVQVAATGTDLSPEDFVAATSSAPEGESAAEALPDATGVAVMAVMTALQAIPADVPGVARSPRPAGRPAAAKPLRASLAPASGQEVDPAALPAGTPLAQLGAFPDAVAARSAWDELAGRHESLLAGRDRMVVEAALAGRVIWRLRVAGFEARGDLVRFCAAMTAAGSECIPTVHG